MKKLMFAALALSATAQAYPVRYCGEDVLGTAGLTQVCVILGVDDEPAFELTVDKVVRRYPIRADWALRYRKVAGIRIADGQGRTSTVTLYRHIIEGLYPGDGENYPIAAEGVTPDGVAFKVVELTYVPRH